MKHITLALTISVMSAAQLCADLVPDPAAKAIGATDDQTYKLYQTVTGSQWDYVWRRTSVEIAFGEDGNITRSPWRGATWRITGPHTITIAIENPKAREMVIHFMNSQKWTCKDWSGDPAYGIRRNPKATQAK